MAKLYVILYNLSIDKKSVNSPKLTIGCIIWAMNFKEAFSRIEEDGRLLSPRIEQKEQIEGFKKMIEGLQEESFLLKIKDRLVDTEALDALSQAIDYVPDCRFFVRDLVHSDKHGIIRLDEWFEQNHSVGIGGITVGVQWDDKGNGEWKELGISLSKDVDEMSIYSTKFNALDPLPESKSELELIGSISTGRSKRSDNMWGRAVGYCSISLSSRQWEGTDRVVIAIADAIWKAGGKNPNTPK